MKTADLKLDELYYVNKPGLWDNCMVVDAGMWEAERFSHPPRVFLRAAGTARGSHGRRGIVMVTPSDLGPERTKAERQALIAKLPEVAKELRARLVSGSPLPPAPSGYSIALVTSRSIETTMAERAREREAIWAAAQGAKVLYAEHRVLEDAAEQRIKQILGMTYVPTPKTYIGLEEMLEKYAAAKIAAATS